VRKASGSDVAAALLSSVRPAGRPPPPPSTTTTTFWRLLAKPHDDDDSDDDASSPPPSYPVELVLDEDDDEEGEDEWVPDMVKARRKREGARIRAERLLTVDDQDGVVNEQGVDDDEIEDGTSVASSSSFRRSRRSNDGTRRRSAASPYTEEEEELIEAMGGREEKSKVATPPPQARHYHQSSPRGRHRREEGYLGDSTLQEIATDYSVPVCYLADVLCTWNVPPPIHVHDRLGDLVTGEQAFALLEAVNSLDVASVQDRYSNFSLLNLCEEWDIDLQLAFEFCLKEGWNLPFGVQTCLRVEQEDELLRVHGGPYGR
jgi:hypothetical protein